MWLPIDATRLRCQPEQCVPNLRLLQAFVDDLGDRDGGLPLAIVASDMRQGMSVDEGELPALEDHAAIGRGEPAARLRAVRDHLRNGQLTRERLALGFEVDAGGETFELMAARIGAAEVGNHRREVL